MEFIVLAVTPNAFVNFRQMRDHSLDQGLREIADTKRRRAKFPEIVEAFRPVAVLQIAPEMILNRGLARPSPFAHKNYFQRSLDITSSIFTAPRDARGTRLISFSRQRSHA